MKKMHKLNSILCFFLLSLGNMKAAELPNLNVTSIPDSLKKNAYGVIRFSTTEFEYKSATLGVEKCTKAITILDKKGKDMADFHYSGDRFRELKDFSGKLYDANGILLRKFKMSEVKTTEWSNSLASDAKLYYFSCETPSFPFTILYEYEVGWKNGILSFPAFYPQSNHNLSIEKAGYRLIIPENSEYRSQSVNMNSEPVKATVKGVTSYEWEVSNLCAIEQESFDPDIDTFVPLLYIGPKYFIYDDVPGDITDWASLGKWQYGLIKNRDLLTDETKNRVIVLTKDAKTDREKVKILYDYLGQTTRYVSIQLGIGGLQPIIAAEVCKTGFGDCKGLSNYMKAMLTVIGIPSNYTVIRSDNEEKTLLSDYANFNQTNHVILQVPLPGDTLWLECTNPRVPFGFVHNSISGHDALVVNEQGGRILRLPDYPDSLNVEKNNAKVELNADGSAKITMSKQYNAKIYYINSEFPLSKSTEQADNLREDIHLPNVNMGVIQFKEDKSPLPELVINYNWTTPTYGNKTGNRLFVPVNPFRGTYEWMKKSKRVHDMEISMGFKDIDSIFIPMPAGFEIEAMPACITENTPFGHFISTVLSTEKGILILQTLYIPAGKHDVSTYPEFVAFFGRISTGYNGKIILRKKVV